MNDKIRELARHSGGIDMTNNLADGVTTWIGTSTPEFLEKFARLIITECCSATEGQPRTEIRNAILNNFGLTVSDLLYKEIKE